MSNKFYLTLISFFTLGSIVLTTILVSFPTNQSKFSNEAHADWPDLNIEEIYNEADIAVVKTENSNKKKITANKNQADEEDVLEAQFTNLKIIKLLKGNPSDKTIILNQALDFVENNKKYLMFLTEGEDGYYYEVTGTSILEFTNNKFMSNITGFNGQFSLEEVEELLNDLN